MTYTFRGARSVKPRVELTGGDFWDRRGDNHGDKRMVYESEHPLVKHKLTLLRNLDTKPKKFRELIREISMRLCYEATNDLGLEPVNVETPMGTAAGSHLVDKIGLIPVLRAGLGMVEGIWEMMPSAEVWHIGLYRDERTLKPVSYYNKLPTSPTVEVCLVLDPMLATGGSASATIDILKRWGAERIKFLGILAAPEGIETLHGNHPDVPIHIGTIDQKLNDIGYIVPGLGDAGDRQFGTA
jgi:uracil phosphoribosyltransferase